MKVLQFADYEQSGGNLPRHPTKRELIAEALPALRPGERITVDRAAARDRMARVGLGWRNWDNDTAPYLVEPMQMVTSRRWPVVCLAGPAQSMKTAALIENAIVHAVTCQPRSAMVVQMTERAAETYSTEKLQPMVRNSPELASRLLRSSTRAIRFRGDATISMAHPSPAELSSQSVPLVLVTDYDRMPDDVGGEGSVLVLARNRVRSFGSFGKVVLESSPARPILKDGWRPKTAHEAPPCGGILGVYNDGTRARLYWTCRDCSAEFQPLLERLSWPDDLPTPAAKGRAAVMVCPVCG